MNYKLLPHLVIIGCLLIGIAGLGVVIHNMSMYPNTPRWRTRVQHMKQLDRIEAKATTILYELSKKETQ